MNGIDNLELPSDIPPEAVGFLEAMGYLEPDRLAVGDTVEPILLKRLAGEGAVTLGDPCASRPVVLIFGSYT